MLDDMAKVFIAKVARNRGVSTETVLSKFGAGGVLIGAKAVKAGMADEVGHFETALAKMQSQAKPAAKASAQAAATTVSAPSFGASASSAEYRPVAPQPTAEEQARAAAVARAKRQEEIDASWRRAAARTNAGLNLPAEASADDETAGAEPAKPPLAGWQKAAAEANKRFGNI
jgi:ClpP class serine protease